MGKMCTAELGCFHMGSPRIFELKFYLDIRPPSTILSNRKPETLGYPTVKTASLCVPLF